MARDFESGSSESINRATHISGATDNVSAAAWIKLESNNIFQAVIFNGCDGGFGQGWGCLVDTDGKFKGLIPFRAFFGGSSVLSTGTWYHVAIVRRSGTFRSYLNGVQEGTTSTASPFTLDGNSDTTIGARKNTSGSLDAFFDGLIAEAAIWDRALDDAEVLMLAKGLSPRAFPRNLLSYKPLIGASPDADWRDNGSWTVTGTTNADHPRIVYPSSARARRLTTTAAAPTISSLGYRNLLGVGL